MMECLSVIFLTSREMINLSKKKVSGIYKIEHMESNKVYIGQSTNIYKRWSDHKYQLNNNMHHGDYLQRSWNKYGSDSFRFDILEECKKSELNEKEEFYIAKYKSNEWEYGYNSTSGGADYTVSLHTIEKKRANSNTKPILQFDLNGNFINRWTSVRDAGRVLGVNPTNISGCCNFRYGRKTTLDSIWIHEDYYLINGLDLSQYLDERPANSKPVKQLNLQGEVIAEFLSARDASRQTGFSWKNISQVCNGDKKTHKGYKWVFT